MLGGFILNHYSEKRSQARRNNEKQMFNGKALKFALRIKAVAPAFVALGTLAAAIVLAGQLNVWALDSGQPCPSILVTWRETW